MKPKKYKTNLNTKLIEKYLESELSKHEKAEFEQKLVLAVNFPRGYPAKNY